MPWTMWDFKKWRRALRYTQCQAAEKLGVSRGTIQHWECERNPIPLTVELACRELMRSWNQRPEFGPVILVNADGLLVQDADGPYLTVVQCERYPNNAFAIRRIAQIRWSPQLNNPFILDMTGEIIWSTMELFAECDRQRLQNVKGSICEEPYGETSHNSGSERDGCVKS